MGDFFVSVKHCRRILEEDLGAAPSRIDWEVLLRRRYGVDALRCPRYAGKIRVLSTLAEPLVVEKILAHLGLATDRRHAPGHGIRRANRA
jgi:hypothetical protein